MFAAGELAMPASDLALWNISMMNRSLLAQASYDAMFTEVKLKDGKGSGYGLGVFVGERDGHRFVFHDGEVSGFVSANMVLPNDKIAVTVLTNEDASSAAGTLAQQIVPLVLLVPLPLLSMTPRQQKLRRRGRWRSSLACRRGRSTGRS